MPPRARPRARSYDPTRTRAAVAGQFQRVREAVRELGEDQFGAPTRLGGWTVRELAGQLAMAVLAVGDLLERPAPLAREVTAVDWVSAAGAPAGRTGEDTSALVANTEPIELLDRAAERFAEVLPRGPGRPAAGRPGPARCGWTTSWSPAASSSSCTPTTWRRPPVGRSRTTGRPWPPLPGCWPTPWPRRRRAARSRCGCRRSPSCSASRAPDTPAARRPMSSRPTR